MIELVDSQTVDDNDLPYVRLCCFIHSLQLCVQDGLKDGSYMAKLLNKCQILIEFSHKSSKAADLLEQINKTMNNMNLTRWNSEYMMVKSLLSIGKNDIELITGFMKYPIHLSNNDRLLLEEIINILEPFHEISVKCQTKNIVTASLVVPAIVHLLVHLRDIKPALLVCTKLVEQLQSSIEKRFAGIVHRLNQTIVRENDPFNDPLYFMATVLDPAFKFYWVRDLNLPVNTENRLKQHIIQLILDEISKDIKASSMKPSVAIISSSSTSVFSSSTSTSKKKKLFSYDGYDNSIHSNELPLAYPAAELDSYLSDPVKSKFSEYWLSSKSDLLKKQVKRIFSVQGPAAPVERIFFLCG